MDQNSVRSPPNYHSGWYSAHVLWKKDGIITSVSVFKIMRKKCCIGMWPMCERVHCQNEDEPYWCWETEYTDSSALGNILALDILYRVTNCLN